MAEQPSTRREMLKKALYVPPAILTLMARPSFASAGSEDKWDRHNRQDRHDGHARWHRRRFED
jgi:hypothetical protein